MELTITRTAHDGKLYRMPVKQLTQYSHVLLFKISGKTDSITLEKNLRKKNWKVNSGGVPNEYDFREITKSIDQHLMEKGI